MIRKIKNMFFVILILLNVLQMTVSQPWCTPECECSIINGAKPLNHAKCRSVETLLGGKNLPIHSLDLSNTNLTKLPHLEKLRDLVSLDVSHNSLSDVDHLGRRIKTLNLSHNRITSAKLVKIPLNIEHLNISYNEVTYLPLELTKLSKLKSIEVLGNSLNCTCETLQVRNWMQSQHVWTDNHIKCTNPTDMKGMPWLQVKQADVCTRSSDSSQDENENDNDLMMGDQPMSSEGSAEKEINDELGTDYLPVEEKDAEEKGIHSNDSSHDGSGESSITINDSDQDENSATEETSHTTEEEEDGSGSGMGPLIIPGILIGDDSSHDLSVDNDKSVDDDYVSKPDEVTQASHDIFGGGLGIFGSDASPNEEEPKEVSEEPIIPVAIAGGGLGEGVGEGAAETVDSDDTNTDGAQNAKISEANSGSQNTGTHILLGVIGIVVICLVLVVLFKKMSKKGNRSHSDPENPRETELADMDKKNLGKPLQKNGSAGRHEHKPLIADKVRDDPVLLNGDMIPYNDETDKAIKVPLLNGHQMKDDNLPESNNNTEPPVAAARQTLQNASSPTTNGPPVSPRTHSPRYGPYPPPKSPYRPSSPASDDEVFQPSSPVQNRYSPVYCPETGKVKIKMSETPKPKTPMLVTRSRSNAGEIITTPTLPDEIQ